MSDKQRLNALVLGLGIIALITVLQYVFVSKETSFETVEKSGYTYIPQFVILSFDGSKSLDMWKGTREFAQEMAASSTPIHFTYFINPVYFLTKQSGVLYQAPRHLPGQTPIGFSDSVADIDERVRQINAAVAEGHEIGSHAVGHFAGADWTYKEWLQEFNMFNALLFKEKALTISENNIIGFRAPELSVNDNLFQVLKDKGFRYDASGVAKGDAWPYKDKRGLWRYSLGNIYLGKMHIPTISMDYNIWLIQKSSNQAHWANDFKDVVDAYTAYFEKNYYGNRAPVIIGHHFSTWNDNMYWEAMKAFAKDVCTRPQVHCVNFRELTDYLDEYGVPELVKK